MSIDGMQPNVTVYVCIARESYTYKRVFSINTRKKNQRSLLPLNWKKCFSSQTSYLALSLWLVLSALFKHKLLYVNFCFFFDSPRWSFPQLTSGTYRILNGPQSARSFPPGAQQGPFETEITFSEQFASVWEDVRLLFCFFGRYRCWIHKSVSGNSFPMVVMNFSFKVRERVLGLMLLP